METIEKLSRSRRIQEQELPWCVPIFNPVILHVSRRRTSLVVTLTRSGPLAGPRQVEGRFAVRTQRRAPVRIQIAQHHSRTARIGRLVMVGQTVTGIRVVAGPMAGFLVAAPAASFVLLRVAVVVTGAPVGTLKILRGAQIEVLHTVGHVVHAKRVSLILLMEKYVWMCVCLKIFHPRTTISIW